jgi:hypothetical protein
MPDDAAHWLCPPLAIHGGGTESGHLAAASQQNDPVDDGSHSGMTTLLTKRETLQTLNASCRP